MNFRSKIFVAGHRGLLGSAIIRRLTCGRDSFQNILTRTSQELDLTNQQATFSFFELERPEYVYMCAAKVGGIRANMLAPADFCYQNLQMQNNVIEACHRFKVKKMIFVGSTCIYPREAPNPIKEESLLTGPLEPTNEGYAIAKVAGIKMCQFYNSQFGSDFISAIPTNLYGINDHYDLEKSHLLPSLILKIHRAKVEGLAEVELWGTGKPRREFMLSDDCADALVFLMQNYSSSQPVNVGLGVDHSILEFAQIVADVVKANVSFRFNTEKPDGMLRKCSDISKLSKLGWVNKTPLKEGVQIAYQDFLRREIK